MNKQKNREDFALILSLITQAQATNTSHKTTVERNDNPPTV